MIYLIWGKTYVSKKTKKQQNSKKNFYMLKIYGPISNGHSILLFMSPSLFQKQRLPQSFSGFILNAQNCISFTSWVISTPSKYFYDYYLCVKKLTKINQFCSNISFHFIQHFPTFSSKYCRTMESNKNTGNIDTKWVNQFPPSVGNQSFVLHSKTNDWFLYGTQHWAEVG